MDEPLFKRMLLLERRRCERTGARFALMLIDLDDLSRQMTAEAIGEVGSAVGASMRETDVTGWYRQASVIGVILTTLGETGREAIESVVVGRTKMILSLSLGVAKADQIDVSCHIFPEDELTVQPGGKNDRTFGSDDRALDAQNKLSTAAKRAIDFVGSLFAVILFIPVFAVIAILIKTTSKGPVFFRQKRVGQFGREFTFLKFRSMVANNDPARHREYVRKLINRELDGMDGTYKIKDDPRVTPVGRWLRKTSMDELPQFINVLSGNMSLVGPRPPLPYEFEDYSLWHRRRILEAKPGITGAWQVGGRSRTTFDDMVRMDLRYIRNQSLWLDVKILLKTPFAVLRGNGAF